MTATSQAIVARLRFAHRDVGPFPGWTNGGIIAGALAGLLDEATDAAIEVRIDRPVPTASDLEVVGDRNGVRLLAPGSDAGPLASARPVDTVPRARGPIGAAVAATARQVVDPAAHPAPGCFVCGPMHDRGLNLQPGAIDGHDRLATLWRPPDGFADRDGCLPAPIVWAALDCPAWYGATRGRPALLGTIVGRQYHPLRAGNPVVVSGWGIRHDGRKTWAGAAIHTADGHLVAAAESLWIHPKEHLQ